MVILLQFLSNMSGPSSSSSFHFKLKADFSLRDLTLNQSWGVKTLGFNKTETEQHEPWYQAAGGMFPPHLNLITAQWGNQPK